MLNKKTSPRRRPCMPMAAMALAAAAIVAAPADVAQAQATTESAAPLLTLPAGPLANSLLLLASQSSVQINADARLLADRQAPAIAGRYTAIEALLLLLRGSGLEATEPSPGVFALGPRSETTGELSTVVVTGTKRSQARQQATQSVAVLSEQDTIGMQSAFDVFMRVPNVTRQSDSFLPTVRGLDGNGVAAGGGGAVTGANPRMSNYVDGVARTYGATPDGQGGFWDMAQVEIYRGAQSTQLGQNSIAGALVQTTQDPKFKDGLAVQLGAHDKRPTYNAAFMLNKTLGEQVAVRFTGEGNSGKNPIDYAGFTGTGLTADDRDELGRIRYDRYRFKALYSATEQLAFKLTLEQERRKNPYTPDAASVSNRRELNDGSYGYFASTNRIVALNANYEIDAEWVFDAVLLQQKANTKFGPPVVGNPDPAVYLDFNFRSDEVALEPKLVSKAKTGRTSALMGAFVK